MPEGTRVHPDATTIYHRAMDNGRAELNRSSVALAFSGFASGLFMGLTALGVAGMMAMLPGDEYKLVALLLYPLGFIAAIIGRAQLFTENTVFPVVLVLVQRDRQFLLQTLRLWAVVFTANVLGALAFAALVSQTNALRPPVVSEMVLLGTTATSFPLTYVFLSGIIGGWLVALMAWLATAAQTTFGRVALIWLVTFLVGVLQLAHCIASSGYILVAVLHGDVSGVTYLAWLGLATAGNIIGGVVILTLLNYWQVYAGTNRSRRQKQRMAKNEDRFRRLNEENVGRGEDIRPEDRISDFVCECSNLECHEQILLSGAEYQFLREKPNRFALLNDHRAPEIENIVKQRENYAVVEKTGEAGETAEQDPSQ